MDQHAFDELVRRQNGLVTRAQALDAGLTDSRIAHQVTTKRWQKVLPRIYATFDGPMSDVHRLRAATLFSGAGLITGAAACQMAGLHYVPDDHSVAVLTASRASSAGFVRVLHTCRMPEATPWVCPETEEPRWPRPTISMAPVWRAALDASRGIGNHLAKLIPHEANGSPILTVPGARQTYNRGLSDVRALICEVVQRGMARQEDLKAELEAGPQHGSALARRALAGAAAGCRSAPECELRDLVQSCPELPEPVWNEPLPGGPRHIIPDGRWDAARVLLEVDSIEWHRLGNAPERTEQRRAYIASLGWTVYPVSPRRLRAEPDVVLMEIVAA